ncbi:DUF397 domain-containing protein [Streptomyces sp. NBC_01803]|nr:DUF397 domain-containing protein [Streptomyces sp. NBC_01803]
MSGLAWQKSSFSGPDGNKECVELAATSDALLLRESDEPDAVLTTGPARLAALLAAMKAGRLNP